MSKAMCNWQRLPNSRMDRQHRPKQFLRQKYIADSGIRQEDREWKKLKKMKEAAHYDS